MVVIVGPSIRHDGLVDPERTLAESIEEADWIDDLFGEPHAALINLPFEQGAREERARDGGRLRLHVAPERGAEGPVCASRLDDE